MDRRTLLVAGAYSSLGGALAAIASCADVNEVTSTSSNSAASGQLLSELSFEVHRDPD